MNDWVNKWIKINLIQKHPLLSLDQRLFLIFICRWTCPSYHYLSLSPLITCVVSEKGEDRRTSYVNRFIKDCMRPAGDPVPERQTTYSMKVQEETEGYKKVCMYLSRSVIWRENQ